MAKIGAHALEDASVGVRVLAVAVPQLQSLTEAMGVDNIVLAFTDDFGAGLKQLEQAPFEVLLVGVRDGYVGFCEQVAKQHPGVEVAVVATRVHQPVETIADLMRDLDAEYIDLTSSALVTARIRRAVRARHRRLELAELRRQITQHGGYDDILGTSHQMQAVFELIERVANTAVSVLITGESGTGKELVARALHRRGHRASKPFVAVNCSAMPEPLLESELFGHVRGAFTDAKEARRGLLQKAQGGTLFLDEIGDMPLTLQPKLLRVLQERTVRPVGGDAEVPIDVRVIAATHRDLEEACAQNAFREDLYYRLNVIHIEVPSLRERSSDILLLADAFVRQAAEEAGKAVAGLSRPASAALLGYGWPGNVRELQNHMERAVALCDDEVVGVIDLPSKLRPQTPTAYPLDPINAQEILPLSVVERRYIENVLGLLKGNKRAAASALGLDRKTLYRKLERYRIEPVPSGGMDSD